MRWYNVEEGVPPYNEMVLLDVILPFGFTMHVSGWYTEKGWITMNNLKTFKVKRWSYYYLLT